MKHRARGAKWAAASALGLRRGLGWDGARWLRIGAACALCFSVAGSAAVAEETTDPGAGRSALPAAKPEESKIKAAVKPGAAATAAADKTKRPGAEAAPVALADAEAPLITELRSGGEAAAVAAAQKLGALRSPRALNALLDSLALGVQPKVAGAVLDALATFKSAADAQSAELLQVLTVYTHHRNPELRKRAVQGLAALVAPRTEAAAAAKPAAKVAPKAVAATATPAATAAPAALQTQVVPMLIAALSDSSAEVRAVAAEALGDRREKSAEPALIKLLVRKDSAAPAALGKIGGADTARALGEMIGNVPDSFITETLGLLLLRPDFGPDPLRLEVVKTIGKLPGSQPIDILSDYLKETGKDKGEKARPSRNEASKIVEQRTAK